MFLRQMVGPAAGQIVEMPFDAAQACVACGTAEWVTDAEIREAGLNPPDNNPLNPPLTIPEGFTIRARPDRGFDLFHGGAPEADVEHSWVGTGINGADPIPNYAAARDVAEAFLRGEIGDASKEPVPIPDNFRELTVADLRSLAAELGITETKKADIIAAIELELENRVKA